MTRININYQGGSQNNLARFGSAGPEASAAPEADQENINNNQKIAKPPFPKSTFVQSQFPPFPQSTFVQLPLQPQKIEPEPFQNFKKTKPDKKEANNNQSPFQPSPFPLYQP